VGKMGNGYGSEFHLLRYLGYHRHKLNETVEKETGGRVIEWLDFAFGREGKPDREWKGLDFLEPRSDIKTDWTRFWPQTGNPPNWDAVGRLESNSKTEYLLVEAKAHVEELQSACSASESGGLGMIRRALETTITANGFATDVEDWLNPYYQYANRLAHLHFLLQHGVHARLIFIYFCGDNWGGKILTDGKQPNCPRNSEEWQPYLKEVYERLGLNGQSNLEKRVHSLFLSV